MGSFLPNSPVASDFLSVSQPQLANNNTILNNTFGVNHYTFTDTSGNAGKHSVVTTPDQGSDPSTAALEPKFYATTKFTNNPNVLQFSRGGSNANPTPVTNIQGSGTVTNGITINLFDFAGIGSCLATITIECDAAGGTKVGLGTITIYFNGSGFIVPQGNSGGVTQPTNNTMPNYIWYGGSATGMLLSSSGTVLTFRNAGTGVTFNYIFSIDFTRIT